MRINLKFPVFIFFLLVMVACEKEPENFDWMDINPSDSIGDKGNIRDIQKVFSFAPLKRYAYCPSVIAEGDIQHVFFCGNPEENRFIDHIYY
ncbi:MAG TPA: hypothetical protein ENN61_06315, partial [Bacteroidaceae bacterium]|nr:hypothetical protein [Bacteroidaceae bacterium]